jgi:hypothetical protein
MGCKWRLSFIGAITLGLFSAGCSKKQEVPAAAPATTDPATQAAAPTVTRPAAPAANTPQAKVASEVNFQAKDLELQVDAYQKIYKRKPESLEQMVREGFLSSLPPAPPGKRYYLDPATLRVSLVP